MTAPRCAACGHAGPPLHAPQGPCRWAGCGCAGFQVRARRDRAEKAVDAAVMRALRGLGFFVSRFQQPRATMVTRGVPDLYALHAGWRLAVWIELKAPRGRLSLPQQQWQATAAAAGVAVLTIRSVDDLLAGLATLGAPIVISEEVR